jgi:hypothetical protein
MFDVRRVQGSLFNLLNYTRHTRHTRGEKVDITNYRPVRKHKTSCFVIPRYEGSDCSIKKMFGY